MKSLSMHVQVDYIEYWLFIEGCCGSGFFQKIFSIYGNQKIRFIIVLNRKMGKQTIFFAFLAILALLGFSGLQGTQTTSLRVGKEPKTVDYVEIEKYLGLWYEQAVIPYYFERDCTKTTAKYSVNPDKTLRVDNSCTRHGKVVENVGKAIPEDATNSKLKVEFVQTLDIGGQYWIVRLGANYQYSVISSPNYRYLWILSRQAHLDDSVYNAIVADLKKDGFPVQKLVKTQQ